jgi:hypothetical protein
MTRAAFIKQLLAANSFIWTNIEPIITIGQIVLAPKYHRATPIKEFLVRGVQFSKGKKSVALINKLDPVDLVTEPNNPYDQFAVAVKTNSHWLLPSRSCRSD